MGPLDWTTSSTTQPLVKPSPWTRLTPYAWKKITITTTAIDRKGNFHQKWSAMRRQDSNPQSFNSQSFSPRASNLDHFDLKSRHQVFKREKNIPMVYCEECLRCFIVASQLPRAAQWINVFRFMARQNFFPFHAEEFCFFPGIASELTCLFTCWAGAGPGPGWGCWSPAL